MQLVKAQILIKHSTKMITNMNNILDKLYSNRDLSMEEANNIFFRLDRVLYTGNSAASRERPKIAMMVLLIGSLPLVAWSGEVGS